MPNARIRAAIPNNVKLGTAFGSSIITLRAIAMRATSIIYANVNRIFSHISFQSFDQLNADQAQQKAWPPSGRRSSLFPSISCYPAVYLSARNRRA